MLLDVGYFWINAARVRHMGNAYRPIKETIIGFTRGLMAFAFRDVDWPAVCRHWAGDRKL